MKSTVLITGGAGFLGRNLALKLAQAGYNVTILDSLSAKSSVLWASEIGNSRIAFVHGSTRDALLIADLVRSNRLIFHLASIVGVESTMRDPISTMRNLEGTLHLVEALTTDHAVVFTSSADVYGVHSHFVNRPMAEGDPEIFEPAPVNRWVYGRVKGLEENALHNSKASTISVRVFNSYGPGMDYPEGRRVIPCFVESVLHRQPLAIAGDGSQRRSFCFVDDTLAGLLLAMEHIAFRHVAETVNIGNPETFSILEAAHLVNAAAVEVGLLDAPLPLAFEARLYSHAFDDTWHRVPDITRARKLLGYSPAVSFRDGLRRTLHSYKLPAHMPG